MELSINGQQYRVGRLDARRQLHVARRLASTPISILIGATPDGGDMPQAVRDRAQAAGFNAEEMRDTLPKLMPTLSLRSLGELSEADCDYVINSCMGVCQRLSGANGSQQWTSVTAPSGQLMYQDMDLSILLQLTLHVLQENLGSFFAGLGSSSLEQLVTPQVLSG